MLNHLPVRSVQTVKVCKRRDAGTFLENSSIFKASIKCKRFSVLPWVRTAFSPVTVIHLADDIPSPKLYTPLHVQPHGLFQELLGTEALPCKAEPVPLTTSCAFIQKFVLLGPVLAGSYFYF